MYDFASGSIKKYLKELSERRIVPGGGSAAALAASLGAGLNLMVINYSEDLLEEKQKQERILERLTILIDEDCRVFSELMDKISAKEEAQKEYESAAGVPMEVCRNCEESMSITSRIAKKANQHLVSDVGCAAHMLKSAFCSAWINVKVNLEYIKDPEIKARFESELKAMKERIEQAGKIILSAV